MRSRCRITSVRGSGLQLQTLPMSNRLQASVLDCFLGGADWHVRLSDEGGGEQKRQQMQLADVHARERAFRDTYQDTGNISTMHRALTSILIGQDYAPTAGVFQSSGWGKSRLVCEFWQEKVWVVYCSFAAGSGYPKISAIAKWFQDEAIKCLGDESLKSQLACMNFSLAYFMACIQVLQEHSIKGYAAFVEETRREGCAYWREVQRRILEILATINESALLTTVESNKGLLTWNSWEKEATLMFNSVKGKGILMGNGSKLEVLFVFDESRHLVGNKHGKNCFLPIRRATRAMARSGALVLFIDTSSEISNFSSPDWADPSDRVAAGTYWADPSDRVAAGTWLLAPPIWGSFSADISEKDSLQLSSSKTFYNIVCNYWAVRYGRPLWWATFKSYLPELGEGEEFTDQMKQHAFREACDLARDKLLGGSGMWSKYITVKERLSEEVALAVLGACIGLDVNPRSKLASKLVANHLLSVYSVSPTREQVWTAWSSEPLVAMAAADASRILHKASRSVELYQPLVDGLSAGWIDRGYTGELVARIILLNARNESLPDHQAAPNYCTVDAFLKNLVGKSLLELCGRQLTRKEQILANARLHFHSFRRINKKLSNMTFADILECVERGCAIICHSGARRVDFLIFAFTGGDDDELTVVNITVIYCQIKIRKTDSDTNVCLAKSSPQYAGLDVVSKLPYLSLYMNVSDEVNRARSYWVDPVNISSSVEKKSSNPIQEALQQIEGEEVETKKPAVQAWKAWLKSREDDLQTAVVVKGLDAFKLGDDLKHQLKLIGKASESPFYTNPNNELHECLVELQKPRLREMFKMGNLWGYRAG